MSTSYTSSHYKLRKGLAYFVSFFALFYLLINLSLVGLKAGNNWATGEWLINYESGFVRRGLFGELVLRLTPHGIASIYILLIFQFGLVVFLWIYLLRFAQRNKFSSSSLLLILSPAGISFISWDRYLFVRKEILGIVFIIILFRLLNSGLKEVHKLVIAIFSFVAVVLSSEVNLFFVPTICFLLFTTTMIGRIKKLLWMFTFLFVSCIMLFSTISYSGDQTTANEVCRRIIEHGLEPRMNCDGAVAMLGVTLHEAFAQIIANLPDSLIFLPILALGLYPIYICWPKRVNKVWIMVVILGVSPLFFVAWDYGRWVFMIVVQLSLIVIFSDDNKSLGSSSAKVTEKLLVGYTTMWGFAHTGTLFSNGWIGLLPSLARFLIDILNSGNF